MLLRITTARAVALWLRGRLAIAGGGPDASRKAQQIIGELASVDDPRAHVATAMLGAGVATLAGNDTDAIAKLRAADQLATDHAMTLYAAAARRQLGMLLGASEGAALIASAEATCAPKASRTRRGSAIGSRRVSDRTLRLLRGAALQLQGACPCVCLYEGIATRTGGLAEPGAPRRARTAVASSSVVANR